MTDHLFLLLRKEELFPREWNIWFDIIMPLKVQHFGYFWINIFLDIYAQHQHTWDRNVLSRASSGAVIWGRKWYSWKWFRWCQAIQGVAGLHSCCTSLVYVLSEIFQAFRSPCIGNRYAADLHRHSPKEPLLSIPTNIISTPAPKIGRNPLITHCQCKIAFILGWYSIWPGIMTGRPWEVIDLLVILCLFLPHLLCSYSATEIDVMSVSERLWSWVSGPTRLVVGSGGWWGLDWVRWQHLATNTPQL